MLFLSFFNGDSVKVLNNELVDRALICDVDMPTILPSGGVAKPQSHFLESFFIFRLDIIERI